MRDSTIFIICTWFLCNTYKQLLRIKKKQQQIRKRSKKTLADITQKRNHKWSISHGNFCSTSFVIRNWNFKTHNKIIFHSQQAGRRIWSLWYKGFISMLLGGNCYMCFRRYFCISCYIWIYMYSLTYSPDIPVKCSFTCPSEQMFKNNQRITFCNKKGEIISHCHLTL